MNFDLEDLGQTDTSKLTVEAVLSIANEHGKLVLIDSVKSTDERRLVVVTLPRYAAIAAFEALAEDY